MKITVAIDWQNDFATGSLGNPAVVAADKRVAERIRRNKAQGSLFVRTYDTHKDNYMNTKEGKFLPIPHCIEGTHGWQFYGETGKALDEIDDIHIYNVHKATFAMSPSDMLDVLEWLRLNGIKEKDITHIEFVGTVSNICVISNMCVFQGAFPNAVIEVNPNLIISNYPPAHQAALEVMKTLQVQFID